MLAPARPPAQMKAHTRAEEAIGDSHAVPAQTRRLLAGGGYGLLFGLGFALFAWGHDGLQLASSRADMPWVKFFLGLPIALLVGWLASRLSLRARRRSLAVAIWAVACGLLGWFSAHLPFAGGTLTAWLLDRRLWGEVVFPYGSSFGAWTALAILLSVALGTAVGFAEERVVQRACALAATNGKLNRSAWAALLTAALLAFFPGMTVNELLYRPLRTPPRVVVGVIEQAMTDRLERRTVEYNLMRNLRDRFTENYRSYFAAFTSNAGKWDDAYVDVVFENGFVVRCSSSGEKLTYCEDFSQRLTSWMGDLSRAGLYNERPWLAEGSGGLVVSEDVTAWLAGQREQLSDAYSATWRRQRGGWVFISARFGTGFEMECRFHGAAPVVVDRCEAVSGAQK